MPGDEEQAQGDRQRNTTKRQPRDNSRNDNELKQKGANPTTKDDNIKHKTQPRMTRHHIPYSHTYHNDKRTHKEDVHTQNKITHTNTHTRTKTSNRRQKSKCDN